MENLSKKKVQSECFRHLHPHLQPAPPEHFRTPVFVCVCEICNNVLNLRRFSKKELEKSRNDCRAKVDEVEKNISAAEVNEHITLMSSFPVSLGVCRDSGADVKMGTNMGHIKHTEKGVFILTIFRYDYKTAHV